jgi:hypothetical protein
MARQSVAIILVAPTTYDVLPFRYFVLAINKIQSVYEFSFPEQEIVLEQEEYSEKELFRKIGLIHPALSPTPNYTIAIITNKIEGNLFFTTEGSVAAITTDTWEANYSPPSLFEYLLPCISASLLFLHPTLNLDFHIETRGCVLDYTGWKPDDRVDIALGYICDSDCESIRQSVGDDYLSQMQLVISRKWIGGISDSGSVAFELKHSSASILKGTLGLRKRFGRRLRQDLVNSLWRSSKLSYRQS